MATPSENGLGCVAGNISRANVSWTVSGYGVPQGGQRIAVNDRVSVGAGYGWSTDMFDCGHVCNFSFHFFENKSRRVIAVIFLRICPKVIESLYGCRTEHCKQYGTVPSKCGLECRIASRHRAVQNATRRPSDIFVVSLEEKKE